MYTLHYDVVLTTYCNMYTAILTMAQCNSNTALLVKVVTLLNNTALHNIYVVAICTLCHRYDKNFMDKSTIFQKHAGKHI